MYDTVAAAACDTNSEAHDRDNGPPLFKKIRTAEGRYIYDTWTNEILEVDDVVFSLLPDGAPALAPEAGHTQEQRQRAIAEIEAAKQRGYLRDTYPEIDSFPEQNIAALADLVRRAGPEHLILGISERCNLRCRYCIYSGAYEFERTHSQRSMPWKTAKAALDWYFSHEEREQFSIGFYGGEPLTAFPTLEKAAAYARRRKSDSVRFNLTTNGTLHSDAFWNFLVREDFRVTFSFDGPPDVHDRYRVFKNGKGSFARTWKGITRLHALDPEFFARNVSFSMVLAPPIELSAINRFVNAHPEIFENKSIMVSGVNAESEEVFRRMGVAKPRQRGEKQLRESAEVLEAFKRDLHEQAMPTGFNQSYHGREFVRLHRREMTVMPETVPSHGQCVPGHRKCLVDTDGQLYMCERVNPAYVMGDVWTGIDGNRISDFLKEYNRFFKDQCARCWAVRLCQKCYNNVRDGDDWSLQRGREFCAAQRARQRRLLTDYCAIREVRDDAFDWVKDIQIV